MLTQADRAAITTSRMEAVLPPAVTQEIDRFPHRPLCYIAGRVKDNPNAGQCFAAAVLRVRQGGRIPVNPLWLNPGMDDNDPLDRRIIFSRCMAALMVCDEIFLLTGHDTGSPTDRESAWYYSKGAAAEFSLSQALGLPFWPEDSPDTLAAFSIHGDEDGEIDRPEDDPPAPLPMA